VKYIVNKSKLRVPTKIERLLIIFIPVAISFMAALGYKAFASNNFISFIFYGFISVLSNMIISVSYFFLIKKNRDSYLESVAGSYFTAIFSMFILIVPYCDQRQL
jgi:hypothetical protein